MLFRSVETTSKKGHPLLPRVLDNGQVLLGAYRAIPQAIREERTIIPAAEWLVDNFHIVDEQLREIQDDLPPGYYRELPKLADGPFQGYPRVFGLAWAFVAHFCLHIDGVNHQGEHDSRSLKGQAGDVLRESSAPPKRSDEGQTRLRLSDCRKIPTFTAGILQTVRDVCVTIQVGKIVA